MKNRPWPIVMFGFMLIVLPMVNVCWNYLLFVDNLSLTEYLRILVTLKSGPQLFETVALYPIAGVSVLTMRKWSYWVFVCVSAWIIGRNFQIWIESKETLSVWAPIAFNTFNFAMITYYFLPSVRKVFFDETIRWWQTAPRYATKLDAKLKISGGAFPCFIANLSQGGALVQTGFKFGEDKNFNLKFEYDGKHVELPCTVVHHIDANNYGVKFLTDKRHASTVHTVTEGLRANRATILNAPDPLTKSFSSWVIDLSQGKGFIPTVKH